MFHLITELKISSDQRKQPEKTAAKPRISLERESRKEHSTETRYTQAGLPERAPQEDALKIRGGPIYWSEINTIDLAFKIAEINRGYSFYEEKST